MKYFDQNLNFVMGILTVRQKFEKFISLGADTNTGKNELKKIKLFNGFCLSWYALSFIGFFEEFILHLFFTKTAICALLLIVGMTPIQYIHYKKKYITGHLLFIFSIIIVVFYFANYFSQTQLLEYYYIFAPLIGLVFIKNRILNIFLLILSYVCFILPNFYFKHYPIETFTDVSSTFLFVGVYVILNYFKTLNIKSEADLETKKEELEKINKYQSQFFINISHEIRTPLTLIKGQIEELKEFHISEPRLINIEKGLNLQVNQIKQMVDDVLDSAKMKSTDFKLNLKHISISELVHKIFISFETNFKLKNIDFEFVNLDKEFQIKADKTYLERALNNLIANALKYTDKGGKVSIELIKQEQELIVSVKDNGIGIAKEDKDRICNQFYQVDNDINRAGGSGIGLSFTNEIVSLHGGKLQILSKKNIGSEFNMIFPLIHCGVLEKGGYNPLEKIVTDDIENITFIPKKNACILIVDDNYEMRQYVKKILKDYKHLEAENGVEGLDLLKTNKVDFVITDYMMPKMSGYDFIKVLKERKYEMPILMLTAKTDKESRLNSFRLGIDDYLNKPFDSDELLVRVENTLYNHINRITYIQDEQITNKEVNETLEWIDEVEQYVYKECANLNFKRIDIAEHFNISESSLYRKIKSTRGKTPSQFITELKLQKARDIINNENEMSLKKLSLEVGFRDSHYFSSLFIERFGYKPL